MNEKMKCFNMHGHTYLYELEFEFDELKTIGYAIDFKEIKRVGCQWIDDELDHGFIVNPHDKDVIASCMKTNSKHWFMSLNGFGEYCNPTVENLAKEIYLAMEVLFEVYGVGLKISKVVLYETPNCFTTCTADSIHIDERMNWRGVNYEAVKEYANKLGVINYDDRESSPKEGLEKLARDGSQDSRTSSCGRNVRNPVLRKTEPGLKWDVSISE
jgi:6-pyruvoyltetrahydropterin/6-carboxytetrahydropterin synthase